jgi:hypothetical protein
MVWQLVVVPFHRKFESVDLGSQNQLNQEMIKLVKKISITFVTKRGRSTAIEHFE